MYVPIVVFIRSNFLATWFHEIPIFTKHFTDQNEFCFYRKVKKNLIALNDFKDVRKSISLRFVTNSNAKIFYFYFCF